MNDKKVSRRHILKLGAKGIIGIAIVSSPLPFLLRYLDKESAKANELGSALYDPAEHYWGFAVDTRKCIGCGRCVLACKLENHVPMEPEYFRTWVERYVISEDGDVLMDSPNAGIDGFQPLHQDAKYRDLEIRNSLFVPKLCNQCENPPCVRVCPVSATYTTKDGVILVDEERCIGCKYCLVACPYGARYLHPETKVADKCTWCYHRISKGLQPACVDACPVGARIFGDLRDRESPVRKLLREELVQVLKPEQGTKPKVYYTELPEGVK